MGPGPKTKQANQFQVAQLTRKTVYRQLSFSRILYYAERLAISNSDKLVKYNIISTLNELNTTHYPRIFASNKKHVVGAGLGLHNLQQNMDLRFSAHLWIPDLWG